MEKEQLMNVLITLSGYYTGCSGIGMDMAADLIMKDMYSREDMLNCWKAADKVASSEDGTGFNNWLEQYKK